MRPMHEILLQGSGYVQYVIFDIYPIFCEMNLEKIGLFLGNLGKNKVILF